MEIYPTDVIAMVAGIAFIGALGFYIYFKIEDKKEEKKRSNKLTPAHK